MKAIFIFLLFSLSLSANARSIIYCDTTIESQLIQAHEQTKITKDVIVIQKISFKFSSDNELTSMSVKNMDIPKLISNGEGNFTARFEANDIQYSGLSFDFNPNGIAEQKINIHRGEQKIEMSCRPRKMLSGGASR